MAINVPFDAVELAAAEAARAGWWGTVKDFCRRRPVGAAGAAVVLLLVAVAFSANVLAPYDPVTVDFGAMLARPSAAHWLGTDAFGRDVLSRLIYGSRTALLVGFGAAVVGATAGAVLGVGSAYFGGRVDLYLQRVLDIFIAFPLIILALAIVAILGNSLHNLILAITIPMIPRCALVIRSSALSIREMPYVDAARAAGFGHARIILRHMLPNVMAPYLIMLTSFLGQAILLEPRCPFSVSACRSRRRRGASCCAGRRWILPSRRRGWLSFPASPSAWPSSPSTSSGILSGTPSTPSCGRSEPHANGLTPSGLDTFRVSWYNYVGFTPSCDRRRGKPCVSQEAVMAYIIAEPCINVKDKAC